MARKPRPPGVPDEAWWSGKDQEWVLGGRDARGRLRGVVRYWRPDGSLVAECAHRRGVPHGAARRYYEDGSRFQTCTYADGKLHGPRTFYPPAGPTAEPPLPGWERVGANVVAYRVDYDRGDIVSTRYLAARGREVHQDGRPIPRRPRGVPATASAMAWGWLSSTPSTRSTCRRTRWARPAASRSSARRTCARCAA